MAEKKAAKDFEKKISKPKMLKIAKNILKNKKLCLNCLGRQFGMISTGLTNRERGIIITKILYKNSFKEPSKCDACGGIFKNLGKIAEKAVKKLKDFEFETFVVGTKLSDDIVMKEESLWEYSDTDYAEPIKSEINRELGKLIEKKTHKKSNEEKPDITIIFDLRKNEIFFETAPLYIYGRYNKLVRGIPQTKWDMYKETVEDIIAKPFMKATRGKAHALHATGREDIDAKCFAWRPFVLEINQPKKRKIDLKKIADEINRSKKVVVKDLRFSDKKEVVEIKTKKPNKTYRVLVEFEKPVENIEIVKKIIGVIDQRTPKRVLHRRADKIRRKRVKNIRWKRINDKKYEFEITGEAGLYIKELVSGDDGRTKPSIAELLNNPAKVKELDVIKIHIPDRLKR